MKDVLSTLTGLLTLGASAALILSLGYDWAFFTVIDRKLLPTLSVTDHVAGAIEWLPPTLIVWGIFALLRLSKDRLHLPDPIPDRVARLLTYLGLLVAAVQFVIGRPHELLGYAIALACWWPWLMGRTLWRSSFIQANPTVGTAVSFFSLIIIMTMGAGADAGYRARFSTDPLHQIVPTEGEPIDAQLLRSVDKGVLFIDTRTQNAEFMPWSRVLALRVKLNPLSDKIRACRWTKLLCPPPRN